ncbi:MAG TPA: hypothetical protein VJU61_21850 [Polyangiaceae bacterium]|nr:hypothetical protein [Polyangiaceae bacterium]
MSNEETLLLVYDGDGGLRAKLLDAMKKAIGREECALCEITYSPVGKRKAWATCEARLGMPVREVHRDEVPDAWGIGRDQLPCILLQARTEQPVVLLPREAIQQCRGEVGALEALLQQTLAARSPIPGAER